ncbi:MAG: S1 RNA-binding domain-containing protein, partial [Planctomycetota bacterium]
HDLPFVSDRAFEQAGGFLRIYGGDSPLDVTGVHPAHTELVDRIAKGLAVDPADLIGNTDLLSKVVAEEFADDQVTPAAVAGALSELLEGDRDPRPPLEVARRPAGVRSAADLQAGMQLSGRVTNVTNFGAFVDVGVQQDGLVHVSELADRFVKDPTSIVRVGEVVQVKGVGVRAATGSARRRRATRRPRARWTGRRPGRGRHRSPPRNSPPSEPSRTRRARSPSRKSRSPPIFRRRSI